MKVWVESKDVNLWQEVYGVSKGCRENDCQVKHRRLWNRSSLKTFLSLFHIIPFFTPSCSILALLRLESDNGNRLLISLSVSDHEGDILRFLMIFLSINTDTGAHVPPLLGRVVWMLYPDNVTICCEIWSQLSKNGRTKIKWMQVLHSVLSHWISSELLRTSL